MVPFDLLPCDGSLRAPLDSLASFASRMVEAAGVEPASEGPSSPDSTCVSSFVDSQPAWERG